MPGIIIIRYRRLDKTHKEKGVVRANALTKRKSTQENEHKEIFEENMAKQLNKKQKVNNTGNDKKNTRTGAQCSKRHYEHMEQLLHRTPQRGTGRNTETPIEGVNQEPTLNEVQLEEQMLEQELMQDSAEGKDQDALSLQGENAYRDYKQKKVDLITEKGNEKHEMPEQVPHHAPTPDTVMDNMKISTSIVGAQIQQSVECSVGRENQTNTGSSLVTNDIGTEMIEPTTKDTVTQEVHMIETPDKGNTTGQPRVSRPKLSETSEEFTEPNDPEWLQPDDFTTMVYKRSKASRK
ncbi:13989_t:CDS:2, partial [Gigaspora margarita]